MVRGVGLMLSCCRDGKGLRGGGSPAGRGYGGVGLGEGEWRGNGEGVGGLLGGVGEGVIFLVA